MQRIALFLATNLAVLVLIGIVFRLLGFEGLLEANGVDLNLGALLVFSAVIGLSGSLISLLLSKPMAKAAMQVRIIGGGEGETERWLVETVRSQAHRAGIGSPEIGVFDSPAPNAFATGSNRNRALVAVSTGLLRVMDRREVEAVLAHEVTHVANGDMVTLALIQGVVNTFVVFLSRLAGHVVDRAVFRTARGYGPGFWITAIATELLFGLFATAIVMWFSRRREFRADAGGSALAGRADMIRALRKLKTFSERPDPSIPDELRAFAISAGRMHVLFASHPPLATRIDVLSLAQDGGIGPWDPAQEAF